MMCLKVNKIGEFVNIFKFFLKEKLKIYQSTKIKLKCFVFYCYKKKLNNITISLFLTILLIYRRFVHQVPLH